MDIAKQATEILNIAQQHGVEQNFFFVTTFKRYEVQLKILNELEKTLADSGCLVEKEYVKGRANVYSHPAIADYNRTADSANKTVTTLMKIIEKMRGGKDSKEEDDALLAFLARGKAV